MNHSDGIRIKKVMGRKRAQGLKRRDSIVLFRGSH